MLQFFAFCVFAKNLIARQFAAIFCTKLQCGAKAENRQKVLKSCTLLYSANTPPPRRARYLCTAGGSKLNAVTKFFILFVWKMTNASDERKIKNFNLFFIRQKHWLFFLQSADIIFATAEKMTNASDEREKFKNLIFFARQKHWSFFSRARKNCVAFFVTFSRGKPRIRTRVFTICSKNRKITDFAKS